MSILDSIHEAEAKAENIRHQARSDARDHIRQVQATAEADHDSRIKETMEKAKTVAQDETVKAREEMEARLESEKQNDLEMTKKAEAHLEEAVDYIVERVMEL